MYWTRCNSLRQRNISNVFQLLNYISYIPVVDSLHAISTRRVYSWRFQPQHISLVFHSFSYVLRGSRENLRQQCPHWHLTSLLKVTTSSRSFEGWQCNVASLLLCVKSIVSSKRIQSFPITIQSFPIVIIPHLSSSNVI